MVWLTTEGLPLQQQIPRWNQREATFREWAGKCFTLKHG